MNPIHKTSSFHSQIKLAPHCQYRAPPFLPQRWLPKTIFWSKSCKPPRIRISCSTRVFFAWKTCRLLVAPKDNSNDGHVIVQQLLLAYTQTGDTTCFQSDLAYVFFIVLRFIFLYTLLDEALVILSVLCQTILYCPTVNKYWQTNGHHQSSCKGKAFSCCCIILIKMFLLSPKNNSAFPW